MVAHSFKGSAVMFKELHRAFVVYRLIPRNERAKVAPFSGGGIASPRIKPVFARFQFFNHGLAFLVAAAFWAEADRAAPLRFIALR
jgi:hypothetical protein